MFKLLSITAIAILIIIVAHTLFVKSTYNDGLGKMIVGGYTLPTLEFSNKEEEMPHDDVAETKEDLAKDSLSASDDEAKSLFYSLPKGSGSNLQDVFVHETEPSGPLPAPYTQNNAKFVQIAKDAAKIEGELDEDAFKRQTTVVPATVEMRRDARRPYHDDRRRRHYDDDDDDNDRRRRHAGATRRGRVEHFLGLAEFATAPSYLHPLQGRREERREELMYTHPKQRNY